MALAAADSRTIREMPFESPVAQRLIVQSYDERVRRTPAFTPSGGSTVTPGDFVLPGGAFLVATRSGVPLGCGGVRRLSDGVGEVKRIFVVPSARGQGVGRALLIALEERARTLGHKSLRLDTDGTPRALALFRSLGYQPIPDYNGNEYAQYWFERQLG